MDADIQKAFELASDFISGPVRDVETYAKAVQLAMHILGVSEPLNKIKVRQGFNTKREALNSFDQETRKKAEAIGPDKFAAAKNLLYHDIVLRKKQKSSEPRKPTPKPSPPPQKKVTPAPKPAPKPQPRPTLQPKPVSPPQSKPAVGPETKSKPPVKFLVVLVLLVAAVVGYKMLLSSYKGPAYVSTDHCTSVVNMRTGAGMKFSKITQVPYGTQVQVLKGRKWDDFWQISFNGLKGYLASAYLSFDHPDKAFYARQKIYPAVLLKSNYSGIIGRNTKIDIQMNQRGNDLSGTVTINWYTAGNRAKFIRKDVNEFTGRIDYANRFVDIGEPRGMTTARYFLTLSADGRTLEGEYIKYEGGETHPVKLTAR